MREMMYVACMCEFHTLTGETKVNDIKFCYPGSFNPPWCQLLYIFGHPVSKKVAYIRFWFGGISVLESRNGRRKGVSSCTGTCTSTNSKRTFNCDNVINNMCDFYVCCIDKLLILD